MLRTARLTTIFLLFALTSCGITSFPTDSESQLDYACEIVNGWPADYASVWPTAVEKHNASPDEVSAAGYMQNYITSIATVFKITESEPLQMVEDYKDYWSMLEMDYINGGGTLPPSPLSTGIVSSLMQRCDELGRGIGKSN
jgi:hypothetical protein